MKAKLKIVFLFLIVVCVIALKFRLDEYLILTERSNPFDGRWIIFTGIIRATDIIYYVILYIVFVAMCKVEKTGWIFDVIVLGVPAIILAVTSVAIINKFIWVYSYYQYYTPFAAMLLCALSKRIYNQIKNKKAKNDEHTRQQITEQQV